MSGQPRARKRLEGVTRLSSREAVDSKALQQHPAVTIPATRMLKYDSHVKALLIGARALVPNDLVTDLKSGEGNITFGAPLAKPGSYAAILYLEEFMNSNITFNLTIRNCTINEYFQSEPPRCIACRAGQSYFDLGNDHCEACPDTANSSEQYILPTSGHCNSFPAHTVFSRASTGMLVVEWTWQQ